MRESSVDGYDALKKTLESASGKVFVFFTGSKVDGKSWCPDCVAAEPVVESVVHSEEGKSLDAAFITCYVGAREYWKDPACPFRTDKDFKLTCVPTLLEIGKKVFLWQCENLVAIEEPHPNSCFVNYIHRFDVSAAFIQHKRLLDSQGKNVNLVKDFFFED